MSVLANEGLPPSNNVPACKSCFARGGFAAPYSIKFSFYLLSEGNKIQQRVRNKCKHLIRALNNAFMFKGHHTEVHSLLCYHINTHSTAAYKSPALQTSQLTFITATFMNGLFSFFLLLRILNLKRIPFCCHVDPLV